MPNHLRTADPPGKDSAPVEVWYSQVRDALDQSPDGWKALGQAENYAVSSKSDPRMWYLVSIYTYEGQELRTCICDGYRYRSHCEHVGRVP